MGILKRAATKMFFTSSKLFLPKKYFDVIYINDFVNSKCFNKLNLRICIWCFYHGFSPKEYIWYDFPNNDYRNYVPLRKNYQNRYINGNFNAILANKIIFGNYIKTVIKSINKMHVIESIGFIENGYLQPLHNDIIPGDFISLIPFIEKNGIVLKPYLGDGGEGVMIISKEKDYFLIGTEKVDWDEIVSKLKELNNFLIQEKFIQRGISNDIYAGSLNTMRIGTMIDPVTQQAFIAYAVHRFGSIKSVNLDNVNKGGLAVMIDLETGKLDRGYSLSKEGDKEVYEVHPVSLKPILNEQIPDWKDLCNSLVEMAARMPYLKYVGWDVVLSDGELYLLEGNVSPGLPLIQMFKPMTHFPAAWNFFKHYKYVG